MSGPGLCLLLAALVPQDRDPDTAKLPVEMADRYYRLGLWERAEKIMREFAEKEASERNLSGLIRVLYRARQYDECVRVCDQLLKSEKPSARAFAFAMKASCAFKRGQGESVLAFAAEALRSANAHSPSAFPAVRRQVKVTLGLMEWKRHESRRFLVFYPEDSPLAPRIEEFARRLDEAFDRIAEALQVRIGEKIEAYYFNDQRQADAILDLPLNLIVPRERAYYALHNVAVDYPMAHVLSFFAASVREKERPRSAFLMEGVACAFTSDALLERRVAELPPRMLREGALLPLRELVAQPGMAADFMAAAGSFVRWLYLGRGREKFLRFWAEFNDYPDPWSAAFGEGLDALDAAWRESLRK